MSRDRQPREPVPAAVAPKPTKRRVRIIRYTLEVVLDDSDVRGMIDADERAASIGTVTARRERFRVVPA